MFVNFSKAFDTINTDYLIYLLIRSGMHGKMLMLIREIYSNVKATVKTDKGLYKFFDCKIGLRQGCLLSPELFIIFINELELMLKKSKYRGIYMGEAVEILLLMYADDIVLVADTPLELKRKIQILEQFSEKWGMKVNMTKTNSISKRGCYFKEGIFLL